MDKVQAEAAAEAVLAQERAKRKWRPRPERKAPYTSAERRLMAVVTVLGTVVGFVASYVGGGTPGWGIGGVIWGVTGGLCVAVIAVSLWRVLASRSSRRTARR